MRCNDYPTQTQRHGIIQVIIDEMPGVVQSFSHTRLSFDTLETISFRFIRRLHERTCQVLEMQQLGGLDKGEA